MTATQINKLVQEVKNEGVHTLAFEEIYNHFSAGIDARFDNYLRIKNITFKIDRDRALSYLKYEWLLHCIKQFNTSFDFEGYFYNFLKNGCANAVTASNTNKEKLDAYADSLDREVSENSTLADLIAENKTPDFSENMLEILEAFKEEKGQRDYEIIIAFSYFSKGESLTFQLLEILQVEEYDAAARATVSRVKKAFKEHLEKSMRKTEVKINVNELTTEQLKERKLEAFRAEKGQKAYEIVLAKEIENKKESVAAILAILEEETYTSTIRRRVSRILEMYLNFKF